MPKRYTPQEVIKILRYSGWRVVRQRGDHVRLELPDGRNPVTVPTSEREVKNNVFASILKQSGIEKKRFDQLAEEVL